MPITLGVRRFLAYVVAAAALLSLPGAALASAGHGNSIAAEHALQKVKDLKRGIGVRTGRELTPALADLAARRGDLDASGRNQAAAILARPTDGSSDPQGDGYTTLGPVRLRLLPGHPG